MRGPGRSAAEDIDGLAAAAFVIRARAARGDHSLALRVMAAVHRRGIDLEEAHFVRSPVDLGRGVEMRLSFTGRFTGSGRQALTVQETLRSIIGMERVELVVDRLRAVGSPE